MVTENEGELDGLTVCEAVRDCVEEGESCEFRQSPDRTCLKTPPAKIIRCLGSLLLHGAIVMSEPIPPGLETVKHHALDNPVEKPLGLSSILHIQWWCKTSQEMKWDISILAIHPDKAYQFWLAA